MTDDRGGAPNGENLEPQVGMLAQYVKDISFENPNAPMVYQWEGQPRIDVQFNIGSAVVAEEVYEVSLKIEARAVQDGQGVAFALELVYAGLFGLRNLNQDQIQAFLLAEAPSLLFPFARRVVAEAVRDGNFPPLMLEPMDFASLYRTQQAQAQQLAEGEPAGQA